MLTIELYNQLRGTHFAPTEHNLALINKLNALGVTEAEVKAYRLPAGSKQHEMRQMASDMAAWHKAPTTPAATPADEPATEPATEPIPAVRKEQKTMTTGNANADALIAAINGILQTPQIDTDAIKDMVEKLVDERIKGIKPVKIEVTGPKGTHKIEGLVHKKFEDILYLIGTGKAVYLHGPAGTGKTVLGQQVAEALGLNFYYSGQLSQEYKFTGFTDAMGNYQPTPFYKAWTEGGLYMLDEMDRSFPDVLTDLNGALANGIFDFPAPIGIKKKHPDFRCIAAGNTLGRGATGAYVAANALDASTLNRFMFVDVDYDKRIEDGIDKEAAEFVRTMRKASAGAGLDITLSYRQITDLASYSEKLGLDKVIKYTITAPLTRDDVNILKNNPGIRTLATEGNKYARAFAGC